MLYKEEIMAKKTVKDLDVTGKKVIVTHNMQQIGRAHV